LRNGETEFVNRLFGTGRMAYRLPVGGSTGLHGSDADALAWSHLWDGVGPLPRFGSQPARRGPVVLVVDADERSGAELAGAAMASISNPLTHPAPNRRFPASSMSSVVQWTEV
jgi:hypothetical protein